MAGSSNFLVFNPTDVANTDSDAAYAAETQRTGGIQNGIAKTSMHNKFYRQVSVMVAALAQFMANQGQTVSDTDVNALTTAITNTLGGSGSSMVKVSVSEVLVTSAVFQTIAAFAPSLAGNFQVNIYFRIINAPTAITIEVTYADATGAQTNTMINQLIAVGNYSLVPLIINATAGTAIRVDVAAVVANHVYVSSSIVGV